MYYKNITAVIFLSLVILLLTLATFPTPTIGLILMFLITTLVVFQTIAVLKGPKAKNNHPHDQWYENQ